MLRAMAHKLSNKTLEQLTIVDERSFNKLPIYRDLKEILLVADYRFRVLPKPNWDRALLLNLTFWSATGTGDVLPEARLPADVVTHVAWHYLAHQALSSESAYAMLLGESIASAFDLFLVGSLLRTPTPSTFLSTQVPALAEAAKNAGLSARGFESLLSDIAGDPAAAFADLRSLLMDASWALYESNDVEAAMLRLDALDRHRFAPLLHHYELSTWVLDARARAKGRPNKAVIAADRALRDPLALDWLVRHWVAPALH
jgi:hypothetical protein